VLLPGAQLLQSPRNDSALEVRLVPLAQDVSPKDQLIEELPTAVTEQLANKLPAESKTGADVETLLPDPLQQDAPPVDWYAIMQDVVQSDDLFATPSMHPDQDERRRIARIQFRKSAAPPDKKIWDNVEKDQQGRTILRAGDCYRVLDDTRATNQWYQENFGQYFIYCDGGKSPPKKLPFVAEVVERRSYLQTGADKVDTGSKSN
jgi:hypothetical protein